MKKKQAKKKFGAKRYDEDAIKKIVAFMKTGKTNEETKAKFGCSAHFAGDVRAKHKVPFPESSKPKPPVKAKKPAGKKVSKAASALL
jgi:hypothetical protein